MCPMIINRKNAAPIHTFSINIEKVHLLLTYFKDIESLRIF